MLQEPIAKKRCQNWRTKILEISQRVSALHIAPAFSCVEITDVIYFQLMKRFDKNFHDIFIMSKGHGCMIQYVILNHFGIISDDELFNYCSIKGKLGAHPDFGTPGIHASTGSLGHGLGISLGQAHAENLKKSGVKVFCLLSDGELQEGSTWEALMMGSNLNINNIIAFVDLNDFGGLERMSDGHKGFYPVVDKLISFGWEVFEVDGHSYVEIVNAYNSRVGNKPTIIVCHTVKGKGVSFMENIPIWHYRSPNSDEYQKAMTELTLNL
jgi:transketolase